MGGAAALRVQNCSRPGGLRKAVHGPALNTQILPLSISEPAGEGEPMTDDPATMPGLFQLPELDMLLADQPGSQPLDPEAVAQWLGATAAADVTPLPPLVHTSSGGSNGTGTTASLSKDEEKQEKARAANRAKQARHRARQKVRWAFGGEGGSSFNLYLIGHLLVLLQLS